MTSAQRLAALRDRYAALVNESDSILTQAATAQRDLTTEESEALVSRDEEMKKIQARIDVEDRLLERSSFGVPRQQPTPGSAPNNRQVFATFGEMLVAVVRASNPHREGPPDPRLQYMASAASGMNEQSGTDGGLLVQQDFSQTLVQKAFETGKLASRVRKTPISSAANRLKVNAVSDYSRATGSRFGGIQAYWADEAAQKTASRPTFYTWELKLNKLIGLCYATDELLEDAAALEAVITQGFADEFGFMLDDGIYNGIGAGQMLGIMNSPSLVTITKESGQAASTINYSNITKMYARFWSRNKANGSAVWAINQAAWPQLMALTLGGTSTVFGFPLFVPPGGASGSPYASILGLPVLELEQAAALGTTGDIALMDCNEYMMIDKGAVQKASSIHVRFIYDETTFRFVYRCNGAPTWSQTLTPYKGSDTLSPFVVIESR